MGLAAARSQVLGWSFPVSFLLFYFPYFLSVFLFRPSFLLVCFPFVFRLLFCWPFSGCRLLSAFRYPLPPFCSISLAIDRESFSCLDHMSCRIPCLASSLFFVLFRLFFYFLFFSVSPPLLPYDKYSRTEPQSHSLYLEPAGLLACGARKLPAMHMHASNLNFWLFFLSFFAFLCP